MVCPEQRFIMNDFKDETHYGPVTYICYIRLTLIVKSNILQMYVLIRMEVLHIHYIYLSRQHIIGILCHKIKTSGVGKGTYHILFR